MVNRNDHKKETINLFLFEDNPGDAELIRLFLNEDPDAHFVIDRSEGLSAGLAVLSKKYYDVILCDLGLVDSWGLATFIKVHSAYPDTPIIVLSGHDDEKDALQTVRQGAQDYLVKGKINGAVLIKVIRYAIERQRIRKELNDRIAQVEKLERERENMLSMFAHDIKNSLLPAEAFIARILSGKTDKMQDRLERALNELQSIKQLVASFTEFTRLKAKGYTPALASCDLDALIRRQIEIALVKAEKKHIQIRYLPGLCTQVIKADGHMLERVVMNLLDNAVKYSGADGSIVVQAFETDDELRVEVQDSGEGIPADKLSFIFDAFYRASSEQKGSGLGLTIAKGIVEAHGGRIWVVSNQEKGSTFSFSLPKRLSAQESACETTHEMVVSAPD